MTARGMNIRFGAGVPNIYGFNALPATSSAQVMGAAFSHTAEPPAGFVPNAALGVIANGIFTNGQTVTLNLPSGGLGIKTNVKPLYWIPLETDLLPHPTLSRTTGSLNPDSSSVIQTSIKPINAAGAARTRACDSTTQFPAPIIFQNPCVGTFSDCYIFMKRYFNHSIDYPAINDKWARLWSTAGVGSQPDRYWGSGADIASELGAATYGFYFSNVISHAQNTWHTDEHIYRDSSLDTRNGVFNFWRDGQYGGNVGNSSLGYGPNAMTRTTALPQVSRFLFFDEYSNTSLDAFDYKHSIYVDDSHQRVMISNEATISSSSSTREVCIPTAWSDVSVSCVLRQGALATLSGMYLWAWTDINTQILLGRFS